MVEKGRWDAQSKSSVVIIRNLQKRRKGKQDLLNSNQNFGGRYEANIYIRMYCKASIYALAVLQCNLRM